MKDRWETSREYLDEVVNYTVEWSPWGAMDRWVINRLVPSEAGLFQIWGMDGRGLSLLVTEVTYYGGLRNTLREVIDDLAPAGARLRDIVGERESWFRYSITPYRDYLEDLKNWFRPVTGAWDDEDREILVNERETMMKFPPPPEDVKLMTRERMKDSDFGPPMPVISSE